MSKDGLFRFFQQVGADPALRSKLTAFAAEQGFEFSEDELTEADLEELAGGLMPSRRKDIDHLGVDPVSP